MTGSPPETDGCEPGRYKPLPEPGPARRSAHRIPSAVRTAARLTVSNGPTTKCPETHARSGKRPEVPRKQVDASPDDTNSSRSRSPKRPQYSGRDAVFPIRQAIGPDSTTRQSPSAAPLPVNAPPRRRQPKSSAVTIRWYRTSAYHTFQAITSFDTPRFPPAVFESDRRLPQPRITHPDGPLPTDIKKIIRKTRPPRHIRICRDALSSRHLASAIIGTAAAVRGPQAGEPPDESAIPAGQEKLPRRQSTPSPSLRSQTENKKTEGTRNKGRPPGNYKIIICWVRDDFILSNIPYFR